MGPVSFHEDRLRLTQLIFWNTVATFLTLGLYRFWARTRLRRHFWHRVMIAGSTLEYQGRGLELFTGFVVVLIAMGLFFAALMLAGLFATAGRLDAASYSLIVYAVLTLFVPIALFGARRYRLTRTTWRGIHFGQEGSTAVYAGLWLFWAVLQIATLGFITPWRDIALMRYRMGVTHFGNEFFRFDGRGGALLGAWLPAWGAVVGVLVSLVLVAQWAVLYAQVGEPRMSVNEPPLTSPLSDFYAVPPALWAVLLLGSLVAFYFAYISYRVTLFRHAVGMTRLGEARFHSTVTARAVRQAFGPFILGGIGYMTISLTLVALLVQTAMSLPAQTGGPDLWIGIAVVLSLGLAILFLASYGFALLFNLTMRSQLFTAVAESFAIEGIESVELIEQETRRRPRFGEGLADAFHFGNF